ncbi:helix-turn-helix domain-containing protein [Marinomonas sp. M1K-6]|uniref:Helix-turn-helix domain-containing protein n=1 Tax=Marinomonas profundi TaxID=2726122 RepID=A0A847R5S1_9GAMM|nr:helix-turn-helix domain-containing protein [Marinomonas profundi]NLQ16214.1 helix-turn-helix domain-containing protein [Marinomonas profundi]UDV03206.1 helix-turn-helix domain-containing protein [Marinomonas profundi]
MLTNIIGSMVRFESVQPGLQPRIFSTGNDNFAAFNLLGIVQRGEVSVLMEESHQVQESSIFCIPHKKQAKVLVPPGSQVWLLGYHDDLVSLVTGSDVDSTKLDRLMRQFTIAHSARKDIDDEFLPLLRLLNTEISETKKRSRSVICSIIRMLLIGIYRLSHIDSIRSMHSPDELVLQQFRQLVEVEYKQRRTVAYYCQALIMTYDRLHAICQRNLSKSPLQLINNRVLIEATSRLQKSSDSIQAIANSLGYNDASQFSHFFKKETGLSPRQFKRHYVEKDLQKPQSGRQDFSDWP